MSADFLKLTAYFGERKRTRDGALVADALLDLYGRRAVASSILLRGVEGFGLRHHLRTDGLLSLSEDLPAVAVAVDRQARIEPLVDEVFATVGAGLVSVESARLQSGALSSADVDSPTKLTVYVGRQERANGMPAYAAVCDLLHRRGVDGASALLGVDGTRLGSRQRARFFARNADVPVMVLAVSSVDRLNAVLPELERLLAAPLITLERVQVCKRDGRAVAAPRPADGAGRWRKLMVYTSESQLHAGRPIHREITQRLRRSGARGVTTLRGVWGFHGDHAPHGDRLLRLGRHVPTLTIVIDELSRIGTSYEIVDELTAEHGLVTLENVPTVLSG
jgi:PII-like signaling protein